MQIPMPSNESPSPSAQPTRVTLLGRLRDGDERAFREFCDVYGELIRRYSQAHLVQDAEQDDLVQQVFLNLIEYLPSFRYNPSGSFRAYLRQVVRNCAAQIVAKRIRRREVPWDDAGSYAEQLLADDVAAPLWEQEWERAHYSRALRRLEASLNEKHFRIFDAVARMGRAPSRAAVEHSTSVVNVYQIKRRGLSMMREFVEQQQREEDWNPR